jgi:hypothetical protein
MSTFSQFRKPTIALIALLKNLPQQILENIEVCEDKVSLNDVLIGSESISENCG